MKRVDFSNLLKMKVRNDYVCEIKLKCIDKKEKCVRSSYKCFKTYFEMPFLKR